MYFDRKLPNYKFLVIDFCFVFVLAIRGSFCLYSRSVLLMCLEVEDCDVVIEHYTHECVTFGKKIKLSFSQFVRSMF